MFTWLQAADPHVDRVRPIEQWHLGKIEAHRAAPEGYFHLARRIVGVGGEDQLVAIVVDGDGGHGVGYRGQAVELGGDGEGLTRVEVGTGPAAPDARPAPCRWRRRWPRPISGPSPSVHAHAQQIGQEDPDGLARLVNRDRPGRG